MYRAALKRDARLARLMKAEGTVIASKTPVLPQGANGGGLPPTPFTVMFASMHIHFAYAVLVRV